MGDSEVKTKNVAPMPWHKQLFAIKDTLIIILTPILLLPLPILWNTKQGRCAYTILIMIIYWMTEVLPMAVTALIPIVLFPWLGVMDSKKVCVNYLKDANMLFFGGLLVAIAVEKWNLHKRVALRVLLLVGSKPIWIMFGFMVVTAFLSMWLNNTATTAMMMPISSAVLDELDAHRRRQMVAKNSSAARDTAIEMKEIAATDGADLNKDQVIAELEPLKGDVKSVAVSAEDAESNSKFKSFRTALKLSIPYASSIGGTGTLIGCGPNIVLKGQIELIYKSGDTGINFTSWLVIGFPAMIVDLLLSWILMLIIFFGFKETFGIGRKVPKGGEDNTANQVIQNEYDKLGKITFAEVIVIINFLTLAFLWLSREPEFVRGWGSLLGHKYVTDACCVITICVLLFIFPSQPPNYLCFRRGNDARPPGLAPPILDWGTANKQMPWSVIILLGGGFALADACKESGLSETIGVALGELRILPPWCIVMIMCIVATVITSFTSNMSTTTILIPIMAEVANTICINPIYLMLPVTLAASWAYILPVSTPPNAIAYSYGDIKIMDMIKAGLVMCVLCNAVLMFSINTWGYKFFNLGEFPKWAVTPNSNCTAGPVGGVTLSPYLNSTAVF